MSSPVEQPTPSMRPSPVGRTTERSTGTGLPCGVIGGDALARRGFRDGEERRRVLDWLAEGLRPGRADRLLREYPLLQSDEGRAVSHWIEEADRPRAHCLLWPTRLRIGAHALRIALVSLVYTAPEARGHGLARRVLQAALEDARRSEAGIVLLWSEADALYAGLGFSPAGCETLVALEPSVLDRAWADARGGRIEDGAAVELAAATAGDWAEIARIRAERESGLVETPGPLDALRQVPDLDVRVARRDGRVVAFAMRGRGDDLQGVIHEWGGALEPCLRCCRSLLNDAPGPEPLFLLSPPTRSPLPWACRRAGGRVVRQPVAWMRIASAAALRADLAPFGVDAWLEGIPEASPARDAGTPGPEGDADAIDARPPSLLTALFGSTDPGEVGRRRLALDERFGTATAGHPPLPLFVWGLESI